jgi:hypothetical protein
MRHLYSFGYANDDYSADRRRAADTAFQGYLNDAANRGDGNILCEIVLTDNQLQSGWVPWLREKGFRRVTRFRNANSGNICNVFHRTARRLTEAEKQNDPWARPARAAAAPRRRA